LSAGLFDLRRGLEDVLSVRVREYETLWGKADSETTIPTRFAGVIKRALKNPAKNKKK
jgi:hypothetical protein